jgi:adenylyltransferase/sulfurtransferase
MVLTQEERQRYSRHLLLQGFGESAQLRLKSARVLVVGAGGLGSPLLLYLAGAGVGTLGIIENDTIDISNLQRQILFHSEETGKFKSTSAKERLTALNPLITINEYNQELNSGNALQILADYDVIADGSDNFATRYLVNDAAVLLDKPLVYGSVFRFEGQVSVFNQPGEDGKRGPNYRDLFPVPPAPETVPSCSEAGVLGVLPGIIGSMQALEIIKILAGIGETLSGRLYHFDALSMTAQTFTLKRRLDNPLNGDAPTITALIDYEEFCAGPAAKHQPDGRLSEPVMEMSLAEFEALKKSGEPFELIDVRSEAEYAISNHGGKLIPLETIADNVSLFREDKKYVFHCMTGTRSARAIRSLQDQFGLKNLFNLRF